MGPGTLSPRTPMLESSSAQSSCGSNCMTGLRAATSAWSPSSEGHRGQGTGPLDVLPVFLTTGPDLLTIPSRPQEAALYHNQTAELRQLLEYTHTHLQADDEVSVPGLCPAHLGVPRALV